MPDAIDVAPEWLTRYLTGPHTAAELAAIEAGLEGARTRPKATGARLLIGTAVVAVAVTMPDLSLFAMGSPYARVEIDEPVPELSSTIWTPAAIPAAPVHVPVLTEEKLAPASLTYSSRPFADAFDKRMPLQFLDAGSERFDLAFAGTALPSPVPVRMPGLSRTQADARPAPHAQLVEMQQIAPVRAVETQPGRNLAPGSAALEAVFAGPIDASGAIREVAPVSPRQTRVPTPRAVPIPAPDPALDAAAAAQAQVGHKTRLGARVNGVLTGSVEFRQLDGTIAIRLGSVLDMLRDRYSADQFERLSSSQSASSYVTLAQLQAAGIPISYNPAYDEVEFGIDYQDAPQAGKVQVEQIGAPTAIGESVMIDQIPRR